jgi:hypothetical protein
MLDSGLVIQQVDCSRLGLPEGDRAALRASQSQADLRNRMDTTIKESEMFAE